MSQRKMSVIRKNITFENLLQRYEKGKRDFRKIRLFALSSMSTNEMRVEKQGLMNQARIYTKM